MIKLFSMFSGFGGAEFALQKANIGFECVGYSEIDKYAIQCYSQNHSGRNFGDCTQINPNDIPDFDLLTGGFPCPSFSSAGLGMGEEDPRGKLFNEIIRIAEIKQPRCMLLENVKGLMSQKHRPTFDKIISELYRIGYKVKVEVLNSKDYGIPQNRERVWFACFLNDGDFENFRFPVKEDLTICVKDLLDENVDPKYNLSERFIRGVLVSNYRERKPFDVNGVCPTLKIGGDIKSFINPEIPQELAHDPAGLIGNWRRPTPSEYFKLMGFAPNQIKLGGLSDTQKWKLAGNGWEINTASKILDRLLR